MYGMDGGSDGAFCSDLEKDEMVDIKSRRCGKQGNTKWPSYGVDGSRRGKFCSELTKDGMMGVKSRRCGYGRKVATRGHCTAWMVAGRGSSGLRTRRTGW